MKLVETDADRPEDELEPPPAMTPPRPEKRRAYASLMFTLAVLVGTVVTIYTVFPAPERPAPDQAVALHRQAEQPWQLTAPSREALEAWTLGLLGAGAPLPPAGDDLSVVGVRAVEVRDREVALVRFAVGGADQVSYLLSRGGADRASQAAGDEHVEAWSDKGWTVIAVGPAASVDRWRARIGAPR